MGGYVDQLAECLADLRSAVAEHDLEKVQSLAHSMKGASKQIGATQAGNLLGAIEAQRDLRDSTRLLDELAEEIPRVQSAIDALLRRSARAS